MSNKYHNINKHCKQFLIHLSAGGLDFRPQETYSWECWICISGKCGNGICGI